MSRLLSVEGHNFVTYKHFFLNLEGDDSLFVGGHHKDTAGMTSNGVGKSLLFDAIAWCPFDMTVRGFGKDKVIGPYDDHTWIKQKWQDDEGRLIEIHRYRSHPKHRNDALVFIDGTPSSKVTTIKKLGTNKQIVRLLGIDGVAFLHSVVFSKGRSSICDASEAKRRELLSHILNLDRFDIAQKNARADKRNLEKMLNAVNIRCAAVETEVVELKARISDAKLALEEEADRVAKQAKDSLRNKKERTRRIKNSRKRIDILTERKHHLRKQASDNERISGNIERLHLRLGSLKTKLRKIDGNDRVAIRDCKFFRYSVDNATCHACGQEITYQIKGFRKELDKAISLRMQLARKRKVTQQAIDSIAKDIKDKSKKLVPHVERELSRSNEEIKGLIRWIEENKSADNEIYDNTSKLKKRIDVLRKRLKASKKELAAVRTKQDRLAEKIRVADFWILGFGPKGIKKYIINGVLDFLQEKSNEYLNDLVDGYIKISWDSERALKKSGEKRDVLLLNVVTGTRDPKEYHYCSLGEKARVWLAVELALNALIRSTIDLALVDEAFDGLDPIGARRAIKMLSDEGSRRKIVCISHKEGMDKFFAKKKIVVMENDVSKLAS